MPPANVGFMIAAYAVTAVIVLAYAVSLVIRTRTVRKQVERQDG